MMRGCYHFWGRAENGNGLRGLAGIELVSLGREECVYTFQLGNCCWLPRAPPQTLVSGPEDCELL